MLSLDYAQCHRIANAHRSELGLLWLILTGERTVPFTQQTTRDDMRLMMLIAYFFSLRPQEVIALRPADFKAGLKASDNEAAKAMESAGSCLQYYILD